MESLCELFHNEFFAPEELPTEKKSLYYATTKLL